MKLKLIVAASENNVIGVKNDLPWNLPNDMSFFKKKTFNSVVIMGKKNYLSIPHKFRPLKNRTNIILTKKLDFMAPSCIVAHNLEDAIKLGRQEKNRDNIFIIGGGIVYKYALINNLVDIIYLTRVHANIKGDVFFPKINMEKWKKTHETYHPKDIKHKYDFTFFTFEKIAS